MNNIMLEGFYFLHHRRVQRGGGSGGPDPFPGPPFSSVTPPPTQPDVTDKCNVNSFLIV